MILVVAHSRTGSTARLRDSVLAGIADAGMADVESLDAPDAGIEHVRRADGLVLCTPARFGALAGLVKDFFERIYPWFQEVPDVRPGLPYALVVKGASDADGAVRDITDAHLAAAREAGATLAAGVDAGLW